MASADNGRGDMNSRLAVVGFGKLGSSLAAVLAARGQYSVIGVDLNPDFVNAINDRRAPVSEPGLQELVSNAGGRLNATTCLSDATQKADATFIVVPTPSNPDGTFSNE